MWDLSKWQGIGLPEDRLRIIGTNCRQALVHTYMWTVSKDIMHRKLSADIRHRQTIFSSDTNGWKIDKCTRLTVAYLLKAIFSLILSHDFPLWKPIHKTEYILREQKLNSTVHRTKKEKKYEIPKFRMSLEWQVYLKLTDNSYSTPSCFCRSPQITVQVIPKIQHLVPTHPTPTMIKIYQPMIEPITSINMLASCFARITGILHLTNWTESHHWYCTDENLIG